MNETPPAEGFRTGFVGIVGRPNVGKSTLMNRLVGSELAIATPKPQTTRDRIRGVRTYDDWQVIYVDTPGIHEPRGSKLNQYMVDLAVGTLSEVDLVYLLIDAAAWIERPDKQRKQAERVVAHLAATKTPALLLLNKIDRVKDKRRLLEMIEAVTALHPFEEVMPISARRGDGCDALSATTRARLPLGPPLFDADTLTDRPLRFIVRELIREPLIMQLGQELPYSAAVQVEAWQERPSGVVAIHATIRVNRKSHKPIVVGKAGARVKAIGQSARRRIENYLGRRVFLDLRVKVDERWVDRPQALGELGYKS